MGSLCRRLHDDEGVTLVEMMVAILILGIVLTALAGTLVTSLASASRQEADIQANAVANALVEDLRGRPFREVALCEDEAAASFDTGSGTEDMVLLPSTDPQCGDPDRPMPTFSVEQDGRNYDVVLAITWVNHPDTPATQDFKRIIVDLTWQDRDRTLTSRTEARRAPEALEQPMAVQIDPLVTRLRDEGDAEGVTGRNDDSFELRATHILKQTTVTVEWQDRIGGTDDAPLESSDGGFTWTYTVPFNDGLFPNGETLFTFTATDPSGVVTEVVTRGLFLHDLEYRVVNGPTTVEVLTDGTVCDLPVTAEMRGMLLSDTLDIGFSHDAATTYALSGVAQTANGADFAIDLSGTGGFPVPLEDTTETITATLYADRVVDAPPDSPVEASWTITLVPVLVCTS